jgi:hypothetical protein
MRRSWICATSCCNFTFVDFLKLDVSTGKSWLQGTGLEAPTCGRWGMRWSALLPLQIPSVSQCWVTIMAVACICIPEMFASCRRTTAIWLQIRYECRFGDMILCSKVREAYEATQCLCAKGSWKLKVETEMLKCDEVASWRSAFVAKSVTSRQTWRSCWVGQALDMVSIGLLSMSCHVHVPREAMQPGFAGLPRWNRSGNLWKSPKKSEKGIRPYGSIWVHIRYWYRPEMSNWPKYTRLWKCLVALFSWLSWAEILLCTGQLWQLRITFSRCRQARTFVARSWLILNCQLFCQYQTSIHLQSSIWFPAGLFLCLTGGRFFYYCRQCKRSGRRPQSATIVCCPRVQPPLATAGSCCRFELCVACHVLEILQGEGDPQKFILRLTSDMDHGYGFMTLQQSWWLMLQENIAVLASTLTTWSASAGLACRSWFTETLCVAE